MAARIDADGDALARYTAPGAIEPITVAGYIWLDSIRAGNTYPAYFTDTGGTLLQGIWSNSSGVAAINDAYSASSYSTTSTGVWIHIAFTRSGTTHTLIVNGSSVGTVTGSTTTTPQYIFLGGNTGTAWSDCRLAYWRVWSAALSASELADEMGKTSANRTTDLFADWPLTSDALDISGNSRSLSEEGTITYVDSPAFVPVLSAAGVNSITATGAAPKVTLTF